MHAGDESLSTAPLVLRGEVRSPNGVTDLSLIDITRCVLKNLQFEELCMLKKKKNKAKITIKVADVK